MRGTFEILFLRALAKERTQFIFAVMKALQLCPDLGQLIGRVKGHVLCCTTGVAGLWQDKGCSGQWGANLFHKPQCARFG